VPEQDLRPAGQRAIDLWIITGFLGSGKTSVINSLIAGRAGRRIGVVVNDFGSIGVDTTLLQGADPDEVIELNGGQIFCACLSGSFVESLAKLAAHDLDAILVESSGLAKPRPMHQIISEAVRVSDERLRYRGMVCVVDADRIRKLRAVVNAVDEQIVHSQLLLINKSDLVDAGALGEIAGSLAELCPHAEIKPTTFGAVGWDELPGAGVAGALRGADLSRFAGWGESGRPVAGVFAWDGELERPQVEAFAARIGPAAYRVKGYLKAPDGFWMMSVSGEQVEIRHVAGTAREPARELSIIVPASVDLDQLIRDGCQAAGISHV
jgi:G3E family GTPase